MTPPQKKIHIPILPKIDNEKKMSLSMTLPLRLDSEKKISPKIHEKKIHHPPPVFPLKLDPQKIHKHEPPEKKISSKTLEKKVQPPPPISTIIEKKQKKR